MGKIFTISAGRPFARILARRLLEENAARPERLADYRIVLPTRRSCRVLQEAFFKEAGDALIMPALSPLGDMEDETINLNMVKYPGKDPSFTMPDIPPAIAPLRRQILLARTILARPDFRQGPAHALALAQRLARLLDQIHTENLDPSALEKIVPDKFAEHWQVTLDFLKIISEAWPDILAEEGTIDPADYRNRMLKAVAAFWRDHPPSGPVIAAGTTGSIPATAELLKVIGTLPQGRIILPGLDTNMPAEDWAHLDETHPQWGLARLCSYLETDPADVPEFYGEKETGDHRGDHEQDDRKVSSARRELASQFMRPASQTANWSIQQTPLPPGALDNLSVIECRNESEEAAVIALLLRETLDKPGKTAVLITPDRLLAARVTAQCKRWNLALDDSAGRSLNLTPVGSYLSLILAAAVSNFSPVALLSLLKHDLCRAGQDPDLYVKRLLELERFALRGLPPGPDFAGLRARLESCRPPAENALELLRVIAPCLDRFKQSLNSYKELKYKDFIKAHLELAETLAAGCDHPGEQTLWRGDDGEAAAALFQDLLQQSDHMPPATLEEYAETFRVFLSQITIRPSHNTQPRLAVLGQLEARLIDADRVIMAGLNEGTWPPDPGHDPWLSRPMRKDIGLPAGERQIGLAAHDFIQGFCNKEVILTRAKSVDRAPSRPARWLKRLETWLQGAGYDLAALHSGEPLRWLEKLQECGPPAPVPRPAPRPPLSVRPRRLSVTAVETWLKDPYGLYAREILKLKKWDDLEKSLDAAATGTLLHAVLDKFTKAYPQHIPEKADRILKDMATQTSVEMNIDADALSVWWPRFENVTGWLLDHEREWRRIASFRAGECRGELVIKPGGGTFTLVARADRIDSMAGGLVLIDYKSGGQYSRTAMRDGRLPQLPLEGLIAESGGFKDLTAGRIAGLAYWVLSGGNPPGKVILAEEDIAGLLADTRSQLEDLIARFDLPDTPYYSVPNPKNAPRFNDYEHLARIREWAVAEDGDEMAEGFS